MKVTNEELETIQEVAKLIASSSWLPGFDKEDIEQAKTFLNRMNFDNRFEIRIVK